MQGQLSSINFSFSLWRFFFLSSIGLNVWMNCCRSTLSIKRAADKVSIAWFVALLSKVLLVSVVWNRFDYVSFVLFSSLYRYTTEYPATKNIVCETNQAKRGKFQWNEMQHFCHQQNMNVCLCVCVVNRNIEKLRTCSRVWSVAVCAFVIMMTFTKITIIIVVLFESFSSSLLLFIYVLFSNVDNFILAIVFPNDLSVNWRVLLLIVHFNLTTLSNIVIIFYICTL